LISGERTACPPVAGASSATGRIRRGERAGDGPVGCCLFIPKDKPNSARREKEFIFSETVRTFSLCKRRTQSNLNKKRKQKI